MGIWHGWMGRYLENSSIGIGLKEGRGERECKFIAGYLETNYSNASFSIYSQYTVRNDCVSFPQGNRRNVVSY